MTFISMETTEKVGTFELFQCVLVFKQYIKIKSSGIYWHAGTFLLAFEMRKHSKLYSVYHVTFDSIWNTVELFAKPIKWAAPEPQMDMDG